MKERGQVTIFIIIAIFIVAGILVYFLIKNQQESSEISSPEAQQVYDYVKNCIEEVGVNVAYQVSENGGYYFPTEKSTESGVAFYYANKIDLSPSKEEVENELEYWISQNLFFCTKNFVDFPDYKISQGEIKTDAKIESDFVNLNINYPISIQKEESVSRIEVIKNIKIPVRMGILFESAKKIIQDKIMYQGVCLTCVLKDSEKNDFYLSMVDYDDETTIFLLKDENNQINNETLVWDFAMKNE